MNAKSFLLAASAALALSACTATPSPSPAGPPPAVPTGEAWFALGTEPFWSVEVTQGRIAYNAADGARIAVDNPGARPSFNGERYVTDRITLDITHLPCSDGMSDRTYRDTVRATVDGRELRGCGGGVVPPGELNGTHWRILSIDGRDIVPGRGAELGFADGRVSGSAGCNRLTGGFTSDGHRLTVQQMAGTRMMCEPALMAQETRLLELFRQSLAMRFDARGRMVLTGNDDARIVLERVN